MLGYYRCILWQPLEPKYTAYAGWIPIPQEDKEYFARGLFFPKTKRTQLS
ncbi:MAG: hypothetical protein LBC74_13045 [Planctomycetaceae bacterium]|nr:hypothetical protein [Planctomycetaceae bacterium]